MEDNIKHENRIFLTISKIISQHTGIKTENISREMSLGKDLGLDGDDALETLDEIKKEFNLNLDELNFEKYFNSEADIWGIKNSIYKLFNSKKYIPKSNNEITIQTLIETIKRGYWTEL